MRKEITITIPDDGAGNRDAGKTFVIKEKSAFDIEWWAARAFMALAKAGIDIGDTQSQDLRMLQAMGFQALSKLDPRDAKPLLDEMMTCVFVVPNPSTPLVNRAPLEGEIEEVTTILRLRSEVFSIHAGFSMLEVGQKGSTSGTPLRDSSSTQTSRRASGPSSRRS